MSRTKSRKPTKSSSKPTSKNSSTAGKKTTTTSESANPPLHIQITPEGITTKFTKQGRQAIFTYHDPATGYEQAIATYQPKGHNTIELIDYRGWGKVAIPLPLLETILCRSSPSS